MAKRKSRRSGAKSIWSVLIVLLLIVAAFFYKQYADPSQEPDLPTATDPVEGQIEVHVIDVGQADAILISTEAGHMLIDAGENGSKDKAVLKAYLDAHGVTELEYFVMTHVHADHIGGADMILTDYKVKNVIMTDATSTSQTYSRMLDALEASDAAILYAEPGTVFSLGDMTCRILGPLKSYSSTNDQSVVIRATFGQVSMMFTGDAEGNKQGQSEKDLVARYSAAELQSDFYKVGHHGSDTSSSDAFLRAVAPKLAAISVGDGNIHGHPVESTLVALQNIGARILRTDESGDLVFLCDGERIWYQE